MKSWTLPVAVGVLTAVILAACSGGGGGAAGTGPAPGGPGVPGAGCLAGSTWLKRPLPPGELEQVKRFALAALDCRPTEAEILQRAVAIRDGR